MGLAHVLDKKQDGRRIAVAFEIVYFCYLSIIVVYEYQFSTMFQITWPSHLDQALRLLGYTFVLVKLLMDDRWNWREIVLAGLIFIAFYGCWKSVRSLDMIFGLILILASKNIPFDRIVQVFLAVEIPAILITIYCSLHGYIANLTYDYGGGRIAYAFGSIYRTDFCAHLFFLACGLIWVSRKKLWYPESIFILWLAWFANRYCYARNSTICLLLLGCGALLIRAYRDINTWRQQHKKSSVGYQKKKIRKNILFLACFSTPVFAVVSTLLSRFYNPNVRWMAVMNKLLTSRLSLGREGFLRYNVTIFGQYIPMVGAGGIRNYDQPYFFLDNSYVNILLTLGIAVFMALVLIYSISSLRAFKNGDFVCIFILSVAALHCCIEHHMAELPYDMFLLLPLAKTGWDELQFPDRWIRKFRKIGSIN